MSSFYYLSPTLSLPVLQYKHSNTATPKKACNLLNINELTRCFLRVNFAYDACEWQVIPVSIVLFFISRVYRYLCLAQQNKPAKYEYK
jgi:hypothetical protein